MTREIPPFRRASDRWITIMMIGLFFVWTLVAVRQFYLPTTPTWVAFIYAAAAMFFGIPAGGMVVQWVRYSRHLRARQRFVERPCSTCGHPLTAHPSDGPCSSCYCAEWTEKT